MTSRKLPGKAEEKFLYNDKQLPTFYQDGFLSGNSRWKQTQYDFYGRVSFTSIIYTPGQPNPNSTYTSVQDLTKNIYGTSGIEEGKLVESWVKNLDDNNWIKTEYSYDAFGRVNYTEAYNHLYYNLNAEKDSIYYDYADNLLKNKRVHKKSSSADPLTITETFFFDHSGRFEDAYHQLNSGQNVHLVNNKYNSRDFLTQKNLHGVTGGYLQNVDYTYNDQGWLTKINDIMCVTEQSGSKTTEVIGAENLQVRLYLNPNEFDGNKEELVFGFNLKMEVTYEDGTKSNPDNDFSIRATKEKSGNLSFSEESSPGFDIRNLPGHFTFDFSEKKISRSSFGIILQEIEDEIQEELKRSELENDLGVVTNKIKAEIEKLVPYKAPTLEDDERKTSSDDLFALVLTYDEANSSLGASAEKNGNISTMTWQVGCTDPHAYGFTYDFLDRLKTADYAAIAKSTGSYINYNRYDVYSLNYDKRGNITSMRRRGKWASGTFSYIDYMTYTYQSNSNKLDKIFEYALTTDIKNKGFKTITSNGHGYYDYDSNGNVISDDHKGIVDITYNHLNLPTRIDFASGAWIEWIYDANGNKLNKTTSGGVDKDYVNGIEYESGTYEAVYHAEGRCAFVAFDLFGNPVFNYEYALKDHLGNTRLTFRDVNSNNTVDDSEILQQSHYYPFGMEMEGSWSNTTPDMYLYNGKELNEDFDLNWLDYGARWYEPATGRFISIDPVDFRMPDWSSFSYVFNNPIRLGDPTGMEPEDFIFLNSKGKELGRIKDDNTNVAIIVPNENLENFESGRYVFSNEYKKELGTSYDLDGAEALYNRSESDLATHILKMVNYKFLMEMEIPEMMSLWNMEQI